MKFEYWHLKDCNKITGDRVKVGTFICMKWNPNDPELRQERFYYVFDLIRNWYILQTKEGKEYPKQFSADQEVLEVKSRSELERNERQD